MERLFGKPDAAARRTGDVLEAHLAALAWVRDTTGRYPSPKPVAAAIRQAAAGLDDVDHERDPNQVLSAVAEEALAAYMAEPS